MALLKENRPKHDFFLADIFDNTPVKDDMASMEHPIFTLSKKTDMRCLEYRKDNIRISITPSIAGLPTIFDKDILLYCISLLMQEVNAGRTPLRTLRISTHDLLVTTNRLTNGLAYSRLKQALKRLRGVSITTNIKTNKREITRGFGIVESYEFIESSKIKNRMVRLEITLSEWFYNAILGKEVLTINRDYFRLGKPIERRLYEIARKHCGNQPRWEINLIPLMEKTGSVSTLRLFRSRLKAIAKDDHIPDYSLTVADDDKITFTRKKSTKESNQPSLFSLENMPRINPKTLDKAREITENAGTGWDFYALHAQFSESLAKGFTPDKVDGAFINFVKQKVKYAP